MIKKIHWRITDICNLKCDYCFHKNKKIKNLIIKNEQIENSSLFLKKYTNNELLISLIGGEPTLDIEINEKIDIIQKILNPKEISISTNGLNIKNIPNNIFINYSIHLDSINREKILEDLEYLVVGKHKIMVMVSRKLRAEEVSFFKLLGLMGYRCEFYKVLYGVNLLSYDFIKYSRNFEFVMDKSYCDISDKLVININGECKRKLCNSSLYLDGNLYNNTLDIRDDFGVCNEVYCSTWNIS